MKRMTGSIIILALGLSAYPLMAQEPPDPVPFGGWTYYPPGGGNAEKIVIVDDDDHQVYGAWFFEKDGGAFWMPWENGDWGAWQNFDAHYSWHMGGDVCDIGPAAGPTTPYALNATMQGHHYYVYQDGQWSAALGIGQEGFVPNSYYRYHDAQFFANNDGDTDTDWFLVSTWQLWKPANALPDEYKRGIFLIDDGQIHHTDLIASTADKTYPKLYRDLENPRVFYTWYSTQPSNPPILTIQFQRVEVSGDPPQIPFSAVINNDFTVGTTLTEIKGFYQYQDDAGVIHQYLLAADDSEEPVWDVWHRDDRLGSLSNSGWDITTGEERVKDYPFDLAWNN